MKTIIDRSEGLSANVSEPTNLAAKNSLILTRYKSESKAKKNIAIIDSRVENYQQLVRGVKPGTEVYVLNSNQDGIKQITEILSDRTDIDSLHIISHGKVAGLEIGSTALNSDNIESYSSQLKQWGKALSQTGNILVYGCNVAAGKPGKEFTDSAPPIRVLSSTLPEVHPPHPIPILPTTTARLLTLQSPPPSLPVPT
jgi:hypothetical protein